MQRRSIRRGIYRIRPVFSRSRRIIAIEALGGNALPPGLENTFELLPSLRPHLLKLLLLFRGQVFGRLIAKVRLYLNRPPKLLQFPHGRVFSQAFELPEFLHGERSQLGLLLFDCVSAS